MAYSLSHKGAMVFAAQEGDWEDHDRTLEDFPNPAIVAITAAIQYANQRIYAMNQGMGYRDKQGMGTMVVGLWLPSGGSDPALFGRAHLHGA
jgi:hypothetical protein